MYYLFVLNIQNMKIKQILIGFSAGAILGIGATLWLTGQTALADHHTPTPSLLYWQWPDSLDAVKAAPANHKIVFENEKVRILEVLLEPYENEPVHTHKWPSVMWSANPDFLNAKVIYYNYRLDPATSKWVIRDSAVNHGGPANRGGYLKPEGPHSVRCVSNQRLLAYRVEFKN